MYQTVQYSIDCRTTKEKKEMTRNYHNCYLLSGWISLEHTSELILYTGFLELDLPLQTSICIMVNPTYGLGHFGLSYDSTKDKDMSCARQPNHAKTDDKNEQLDWKQREPNLR